MLNCTAKSILKMRSRFSCGLKCLCLDGSDPLNELWSFSSCPFMGRELGDGGKLSAGQPNHICITKEVTHKCACVSFAAHSPMWLELPSEVGKPVEEKNEGHVLEGEELAW